MQIVLTIYLECQSLLSGKNQKKYFRMSSAEKFTDDTFKYFFLYLPENRLWDFMQIVSLGDNLLEMPKPIVW